MQLRTRARLLAGRIQAGCQPSALGDVKGGSLAGIAYAAWCVPCGVYQHMLTPAVPRSVTPMPGRCTPPPPCKPSAHRSEPHLAPATPPVPACPHAAQMSDASSKSLMSSYISQRIQDASASRRFTFASPSVNGAAARPLPTRQYSVPQLTVPASTNVDAAQPAEEGAAAAAAASVRANVTAPSAPDAAASDTSGTVELTFWASSPIAASKQQKSPSPLGV